MALFECLIFRGQYSILPIQSNLGMLLGHYNVDNFYVYYHYYLTIFVLLY